MSTRENIRLIARTPYLTSMDYSSWAMGWNSRLAPVFGLVWSYTLIKLFKCY